MPRRAHANHRKKAPHMTKLERLHIEKLELELDAEYPERKKLREAKPEPLIAPIEGRRQSDHAALLPLVDRIKDINVEYTRLLLLEKLILKEAALDALKSEINAKWDAHTREVYAQHMPQLGARENLHITQGCAPLGIEFDKDQTD